MIVLNQKKYSGSDIIESYITYNNKKLKKGYTTGSCAAAATKAAILALLGQNPFSIDISTLEGEINIPIKELKVENNKGFCTIIKYSGDDPDITNGTDICAEVTINTNGNIDITGGIGVGIITLPGLKVAVGKSAINPVPMNMIKVEATKVLPDGSGADIIISVPNGKELAKKTFNPRLGIIGGISILGTSGIVTPMSEDAYKESLALSLDILLAKGYNSAVFTFGEYSKDYAYRLNIPKQFCVTTSNFIGYMLDYALNKDFKNIIIIGHIGKLVKVAGGIFNTHSNIADCRIEIIMAYAALEGADIKTINEIYNCITTSATIDIIDKNNITKVYDTITENVKKKSQQRVYNKINIEVILFCDNNKLLSQTAGTDKLLEQIYKWREKTC